MSFYNDLSKWNNFLNEELLIESRLKAAMKKFPEIDEYYIKQLSNSDPSGKNAYLMWMAQALKDAGAGIYTVPGLASEKVIEIVPAVTAFDKAKQRISQLNKQRKKAGKSLYPNDVNQFGSLEDLEDFLDELGISGSEKRKKEKEAALGGATILQDDDDFFVIRPLTKESSCYFGKDTTWCITMKGQSHYESYTRQGKAFYFVLNKNLPGKVNKKRNWKEGDNPLAKEGHPGSIYKKLALVYDKSGQLEEWYDVPDDGHTSEEELSNILLYNIIAPALAQTGKLEYGGAPLEMAVPTDGMKDFIRQAKRDDSLIDGIAAALRSEDSLLEFLGSDDPQEMYPEEKKIYQSIVAYLKKTGDDLPINVDEIPDMEDTFDQSPDDNFLYPVDLAAEVFDSIAVNTVEQVKYEAQQDTLENRPGSFDSEDLRDILQNAGLQHIDVYYDDYDYDEWTWNASFGFDMDESPFNLLQYKNPDFDPDEEESDDNFKYGDYDDAYGGSYSDEDDIEKIIRDSIESHGIYPDSVERVDTGRFNIELRPDYNEQPSDGLDGFEQFVSNLKDVDKYIPEIEEQIYESLQDHDLAIHPDSRGAEGENWVDTLKSLKHLGYDVKSGKMDVFGKAVFEIPNMMRNMRELRKIFPALPEGEVVTTAGAMSDEYKEIYRRQEGLVNQLEYYLNREMDQTRFAKRMMLNIGDQLNKAQPPGRKFTDKGTQMSLPGTGRKGPADLVGQPGSLPDDDDKEFVNPQPEVDFLNQYVGFAPKIKLMTNIQKGEKESSELSIGDREITGAHGVGSFGFFALPIKFWRDMKKKSPEMFQSYMNGFKYIDENWQDFQDMIGEYVSSQIVPVAKTLKGKPELADLEREDIAQSARAARPKSGLREQDELTEAIVKEMEYAKKMTGKATASDIVWGVKNVSKIGNKYSLKTLQASIKEAIKRTAK
jgi:hypothetical protein